MCHLWIFFSLFLLSFDCIAQEQDIISASQSGASAAFFRIADPSVPTVEPGDFNDEEECQVRNGLPFFFRKAEKGQAVRIAYLGGSITRSDNMYRMQSYKFIQSMFPAVSMQGINAGVSGTDADLGACRLYEQVLTHNPDLLFIEFAVNGGFALGVEGIIRQARKYNPEIDICLIYSVTSKQLEEYKHGRIPIGIQRLDSIAQHYSIPSIHMAREAAKLAKSGKLIEKGDPQKMKEHIVFSQDGVHPLEEGGNLYAGAIARSMLKMKAGHVSRSLALPRPFYANNWEDAKMLSPLNYAEFSSEWKRADPDQIGFSQYKAWFPYILKANKAGASFHFTFKGSMFGIFDIGGPDVGQLELLVDGESVQLEKQGTNRYKVVAGKGFSLNRFNAFCNNRYRGQFICIELPEGHHRITLKISKIIPDKRKILGKHQLEDISAHPDKYQQSTIYLGKILIRGNADSAAE